MLVLLTHPLLDAHTAYGTQLFWPLDFAPTSWSTIFIIDPLYTVPLFIGVLAIVIRPNKDLSSIVLSLAIACSTTYLAWSWLGKYIAEKHARSALVGLKLEHASLFSTPTPFNTLLWRFIVLTDDAYMEAYYSLLSDGKSIQFNSYPLRRELTQEASELWSVQRLNWFSRGFIKAYVEGDKLVISDLRMGAEPDYVFNHVVAIRHDDNWQDTQTKLISPSLSLTEIYSIWKGIWLRIPGR